MVFKLVSIFMQFAYTWKLCELLETYDRRKRSQGEPEGLTETSGNEAPLSMILYNSSPFLSLTQMMHSFAEILFMTICSLNFTFICLRLKYLIGLPSNNRRAWNISET